MQTESDLLPALAFLVVILNDVAVAIEPKDP
jgi:hypothetical protein